MTPDVYTQLEFVNATSSALIVSPNPPAGVPAFNAYQMASWLTFPGPAPSPIVAPARTATYRIQALRGGGDEDDAADLVVSTQNGQNLFHLYAGSTSDSAHYLMAIPLAQPNSQMIVGVSTSQVFEQTPPANMQWSVLTTGSPNVPLNLTVPAMPAAPQALVVADLSLFYDSATATDLIEAIGAEALTPEDLQNLYAQVTGYCFAGATTLSYTLSAIDFADPPPIQPGTTALIGKTTATVTSGSLEVSIDLDQSITNTFTLTSDQTWAIGTEVKFSLPFKLAPEATLTGSFESSNGEATEMQQAANFGTSATMTMPGPGTYVVTATALIAQNYTAPFTGTLQVTGVAAAPQGGSYPLTGTLLALLLAPGSPRSAGLNAGPVTPGPNLVTVPVSGSLTGSFGYQLVLNQATANPSS